ncbi:hypothetical protein [uncultured Thiothrix sp.]|uniref:hypothetical protein n=1 Tax=uncultured Thiothrix sp. TaxID=223185 RepID=UPI0026024C8F|nr:hypothetical protein [uncultured Thiothrix sp.]HMT93719.1 hypothetical protein [Thiolinea sp.]
MIAEQIRAFVSPWYRVAHQPNGWAEQQAEKYELSDEIFSRPYLPEITKNAMLLTLFIDLAWIMQILACSLHTLNCMKRRWSCYYSVGISVVI